MEVAWLAQNHLEVHGSKSAKFWVLRSAAKLFWAPNAKWLFTLQLQESDIMTGNTDWLKAPHEFTQTVN